jgi:hypothetical protein
MPRTLDPLPGTAPDGTWRIGNMDRENSDGRLAIFAIVSRPTAHSLTLVGTGFYVLQSGGFVTAKHVALDIEDLMSEKPNAVGIAHTFPDGRVVYRPISKFFVHPTADVAFGLAAEITLDDTGEIYRSKVLSMIERPPEIGASISTLAYPLHRIIHESENNTILQLQPDFYDGVLQELYLERGPSGKLVPPYYLSNIHLHGGASGGPVFNEIGQVFGIASCSYDGAEDVAFITPINAIFEIELTADLGDGRGSRTITVRDIPYLTAIYSIIKETSSR